MTPETSPLITSIAAVLQKDYGLGPDSATSIVRRVLELSAAHYAALPTGFEKATEAIKKGVPIIAR